MKNEAKLINERGTLQLGLIGLGWVTERLHLPALKRTRSAHLFGVADQDQDQLTRVAEQFQIPRRYSDYRALLDEPGIEAVGVWLPDEKQVEAAQAVLAAKKHLIIEKPLLLDLKIWDKLIEQAENADRQIIVVGLPRRWHRHVRRARTFIDQGILGKIRLIRTALTGRNPEHQTLPAEGDRHPAKGVLYHFGVQHFDTLQALFPSNVQEISAISSADESTVAVTGRMSDGVVVSSTFSEGESLNDEVEIYGQAGCLRVSCYRFDGFEYFTPAVHPGDLKFRMTQAMHSLMELPQGLLRMRRGGDFIDSYRAGWHHCVDAIRRDVRPDCTLVEARRALQLVLTAKESVRLGRPVKLNPPAHDRV